MASRPGIQGLHVDIVLPDTGGEFGTSDAVETRENSRSAHNDVFSGEAESCDVTLTHGEKIAVRVHFTEDFEFHGGTDVKVIVGIGDSKTFESWTAVQAWSLGREVIEAKRQFFFRHFEQWAANGEQDPSVPFRAPDLIGK